MLPEEIALAPEFQRARHGEATLVGDITADAFRDDPFNAWLFGTVRGMAGVFRALARHVYIPRGFVYRLGDEGAAMWMLPGGDIAPPLAAQPALVWSVLALSRRGAYRRAERAVAAMEAAHPTYPHAYLFTIGVRPSARGKGRGRQLIAPVLEACDRAGLPAYLENSNPDNRGFYGACGFEHVAMLEPEPGAPPLEAMARQPRS